MLKVKTKKGVSVANLSHPNSRKVQQLTKQVKKIAARKKSKNVHQMKQNLMGEKVLWFRDNLPENVSVLDHEMIANIIEKYLSRFDEELEQIQLKHSIGHRKNRQHASREDIIKLTQKHDDEEYKTCGIELPDLTQQSQLELLRKWSGELRFLQNFKLRRFSSSFLNIGRLKSIPSSPNHNSVRDISQKDKTERHTMENMETDVCEDK